MNWHGSVHSQTTTRWLKTTLQRIGQLGAKIYHQTCAFNGCLEWTLNWNEWVDPELLMSLYYITWKHTTVLGNALVNTLALLLTETFCWILSDSVLYLDSGCLPQYDSQAFLFSLVNKPGWAPVKFGQTGAFSYHRSHSIYSCYDSPPTFGLGHDLQVRFLHKSYSKLGYTYSPPNGYSYRSNFTRSFLAGSYFFNPDEIETFYDAAFKSQSKFGDN